VGQDDRRAVGGNLLERILAVDGDLGGEAPAPQQLLQPDPLRRIVFDDENVVANVADGRIWHLSILTYASFTLKSIRRPTLKAIVVRPEKQTSSTLHRRRRPRLKGHRRPGRRAPGQDDDRYGLDDERQ